MGDATLEFYEGLAPSRVERVLPVRSHSSADVTQAGRPSPRPLSQRERET